jgi:hypothetical protein
LELKCWYCSKIQETTEYHLMEYCPYNKVKSEPGRRPRQRKTSQFYKLHENLNAWMRRKAYERGEPEVKKRRGLRW